MTNNFKILKDAGISVVRMWLMADGTNYDGIVETGFANNRGIYWDFIPPEHVDASFLNDFRTLLDICEGAKIQLMPVLIDFTFFAEPLNSTYVRFPRPGFNLTNLDYSGGKRSIAANPSFRQKFIEGTFEPLLKIASEKKESIYAFDVMNEPWWCIDRFPFGSPFAGQRMEKNDLISFLLECTASIKKFGLRSTIGHRFLSDVINTFSIVKVDLTQHHYYPKTFQYTDCLQVPNVYSKPAKILGEFASITLREFEALKRSAENERDPKRKAILDKDVKDFDIQKGTWPDLKGMDNDSRTVLEVRLKYLEKLGYELAMMWNDPVAPEKQTSDVIKLAPEKLESIKRFTSKP
ncbi:MAG: hypothetical protein JO235_20555 [Chroococcidiopsidaceae cyanobacterium CP_BM_RX_35]|nr:hypothetical protein [Chroococcidiopsidaceae cyanobacterium CP_BM_RX_35]